MTAKRFLQLCFLALILKFSFPASAHAYLDPGSGSFILQIVLAGIMGFILMVKIYWKKIRTFVGGMFSRDLNGDD